MVHRFITSLILCFTMITAFSQDDGIDTTYYERPDKRDRLILDLGHSRWLDAPEDIEMENRSYNVNAYYMYDIPFGESVFGVALGFGISSHNVHHNGGFVDTTEGGDQTSLIPFDDGYDPEKNKLSVNYLEVPLELRFRTHGKNAFKIYVGGKVGYLVNDHTKRIDDLGKRKFYNIDGISDIRYGLHGRIGFGHFNAYAFYSLTPLFEEGKGPQMTPVSVGISLTLF